MRVFQITRRVAHSANDMFALVADMERYPEFVPLCQRNAIRSRDIGSKVQVLTTEMTVAYKIFRETFRNRVTLDPSNGRILVEAADRAVRLQSCWIFQSHGDGSSDVGFSISYELASRALTLLTRPVFEKAFTHLIRAFEERANLIYGQSLRQQSPPEKPST